LVSIGNVYIQLDDSKTALLYYNKALKIFELLKNKAGVALSLSNIGNTLLTNAKYQKSLNYSLKALNIYKALNDKINIVRVLSNVGETYYYQSDYSSSLKYEFESLRICNELELKKASTRNMSDIGRVYLEIAIDSNNILLNKLFGGSKTRALNQAKGYIESAIMVSKKISFLDIDDYEILSEIQNLLGDCEGALENFTVFSYGMDSVLQLRKDKKIIQTVMQYEFDKKEAFSKAEQEKKDILQSNIRNSFIGGFILMLILAGVSYNS